MSSSPFNLQGACVVTPFCSLAYTSGFGTRVTGIQSTVSCPRQERMNSPLRDEKRKIGTEWRNWRALCVARGLRDNNTRRTVWPRMLLTTCMPGGEEENDDKEDSDVPDDANDVSKCSCSEGNSSASCSNGSVCGDTAGENGAKMTTGKMSALSSDGEPENSNACGNVDYTIEENIVSRVCDKAEDGDSRGFCREGSEEHAQNYITSIKEFVGLSDNCHPRIIRVDVERSLWHLYPDESVREQKRRLLTRVLLRTLSKHKDRHYYQGLHELVGFVVYVVDTSSDNGEFVDEDIAVSVCERLLTVQWRSFSDKRLNQSQSMLYAMHAVVAQEDVQLASELESCGVAPESHYAVAWLITWFSHICNDVSVLGRVFDFLVAYNDENIVIFLAAALVLHEKKRIMAWIREAHEKESSSNTPNSVDGECNLAVMACVYAQLVSLPKEVFIHSNADVVEDIIRSSVKLRKCHAGSVLQARVDFLHGRVARLGLLADRRTRNSALRRVWNFLFREWRTPWQRWSFSRRVHVFLLVPLLSFTLFSGLSMWRTVNSIHSESLMDF
ncbi:putative GTPase activating protein of Rab-like GTPase [Trypanosoma vivax]|nr:putative GTPase activating protein of Rab-like GTPase [Trypanosoma vivax]